MYLSKHHDVKHNKLTTHNFAYTLYLGLLWILEYYWSSKLLECFFTTSTWNFLFL